MSASVPPWFRRLGGLGLARDHDVRALAGETQRDRLADAATASVDEHGLSGEAGHGDYL